MTTVTTPTETISYVAIAPFGWGMSKRSIDEAVKIAKENMPGQGKHASPPYVKAGAHPIFIFAVHGDFFGVTGMGAIQYKGRVEELGQRKVVVR